MSTVKTEKRTDPFKPVIRKKDMDRDMYNDIERMAKECVENPKEKFKDENVYKKFLIFKCRKLQIISRRIQKINIKTEIIAGMLQLEETSEDV